MPWPYNKFVYEVQRGDFSLSFAVAPADKDVHVLLKHRGTVVYELEGVLIEDVRYHADKPRHETVEIVANSSDRLWLRLNPAIQIIHELCVRT